MAAEAKLQARVVSFLTDKGWYVLKVSLCNKPGHPDMTAFKDGRVVMIEFKAPGKKATPLQVHRHTELAKRGFTVHVIDNWDEFLKLGI